MYIQRYAFYKIDFPKPGQSFCHSIVLKTYESPQHENSDTREMRKKGFKSLRVNEQIYNLLLAAQAATPI